jgi:nitroreductase
MVGNLYIYFFITMEIIDAIKTRKSVRCFKKNDAISKADILSILDSAKWAPSAKNLQPVEFIVIEDGPIKEALSVACHQNQPKQVPVVIAVIGNLNISRKMNKISTHNKTTNYKATNIFIYMDAAAAIQNMLLTATSLGIDSLWIGSFDEKMVRQVIKLPAHYTPLAIVCFGHRLASPFAPRKREIRERLYINYFENKVQDMSYLEQCKLINEKRGELKRYD